MSKLVGGKRLRRWTAALVAVAVIAVGGVVVAARRHGVATPVKRADAAPAVVLGAGDTLRLSHQVTQSLGIRMVQATSACRRDHLTLSGSLFLDPNRLVHVHSRFAGEVVSMGVDAEENRPLRAGDQVTKGQLLAVIWSKDVGEKKSDLVDALSQLFLDRAQFNSLKSLGQDVVARRQLREAERMVEADVILVERLERTLRSWRLTEQEIDVVRAEAEKIHQAAEKDHHEHLAADLAIDKSWAEVEVRSPMNGVILEKNIVTGDIVDTSLDLFKIADLSMLGVMANVYEEDLPTVEALPSRDRKWLVQLKSQPDDEGIAGVFSLIGSLVDPNQHTGALIGWLENKAGLLRAGQFITASIDVPCAEVDVVVPDEAVIQEGSQCVVFVGRDASGRDVTRRVVALASRGDDVVYIRAKPTPAEQAAGCQPLEPGEWVVASGTIELDGALERALARAAEPEASPK